MMVETRAEPEAGNWGAGWSIGKEKLTDARWSRDEVGLGWEDGRDVVEAAGSAGWRVLAGLGVRGEGAN